MVMWKCPKCGFEKNVVCPVCGADKEAGATCTACGSEYSHTTCPKCDYSSWHETPLESLSYQEKIKDILKLRADKYFTYYELMRLTALFNAAALEKICKNDPIDVKNLSSQAFEPNGERLKTLTKIRGVDNELARKILEILEDVLD